MAKINCSIKIIFILSVVIILECTQLGGRADDYFDVGTVSTVQEGTVNGARGNDYAQIESVPTMAREFVGKVLTMQGDSESFEITRIRPDKIFTPNGDGWNDYFEIQYINPYDALVSGKIYDLKGRLVANMKKEENEEIQRLIWNGNDLNDNPVTGGLYIYQVEVSGPENKVIKGTIILVK